MPKGVYKRLSAPERILENIIKQEDTGCWFWCGLLDKDGYGQISDNCKTRHCHRVMFEYTNGEIEKGLVLSHLCDEKYPKDSKEYRKCCNPEHLEAITTQENTARMVMLGRSKISEGAFKKGEQEGENNLNCKLTDEKLLEFHKKVQEKLPYGGLKKIAEEYSVSYALAQKIRGGTYTRLIDLLKK